MITRTISQRSMGGSADIRHYLNKAKGNVTSIVNNGFY